MTANYVLCNVWVAEKESGERAEKDVYILAQMINALDFENFCCHSLFSPHKFTRIGVSEHIPFLYLPVLRDDTHI